MDLIEKHGIGLVGVAVALVTTGAGAAYIVLSSKKPKACLDPENFREIKCVKCTQLSHNVAKFKFALPTPISVLGLPIGQHISCRGKDSLGEDVIKPYTPTTLEVDTDVGHFELLIKGSFKYQPNQVRAFGMLAGGSGITPMFQIDEPWASTEADIGARGMVALHCSVDMFWTFMQSLPCGIVGSHRRSCKKRNK